ncbi:uncharacterized protein ACB058_006465 [Synchiropus picturatus]
MDGPSEVLGVVRKADVSEGLVQSEDQEWHSNPDRKEAESSLSAGKYATKFPFAVNVKTEYDEDEVMSSQPLHLEPPTSSSTQNMKTEGDGDECEGPDADTYLGPGLCVGQQRSPSVEYHIDDNGNWWDASDSQSHSSSVHTETEDSEGKSLICSDCGRRCSSKAGLTLHKSTCTGESLSCLFCGKWFTQRGNLEIHTRIHTGEKPFSCPDCGQCFNRSDHLKDHMRIHTGEKPFSCSECGQSFHQSGNLKAHMRIHTGEKPFGCSECGKAFNRRQHLTAHTRIHTGEKPFCCSECGKCFTESGDLKKHVRRRH